MAIHDSIMTTRNTTYSDEFDQTGSFFSPLKMESAVSSFTRRKKVNRSHYDVDGDTEVDEKSFVSTCSDSGICTSATKYRTEFEKKFPDVAIDEVDFESQITMDDEAFDRFRASINKAVCRCYDFLYTKNGKEHYMFLFIILSSIAACKLSFNTIHIDEIEDLETIGIPEVLLSSPKVIPVEEGRTIFICHEETRKNQSSTSDQLHDDSLTKIYDAVFNVKGSVEREDDDIFQLFNRLCYFHLPNHASEVNHAALGAHASAGQFTFVRTFDKLSSEGARKISIEKTRVCNLFSTSSVDKDYDGKQAIDSTLDDSGILDSSMRMNLNEFQYDPVDSKIVIEHLFSMVFGKFYSASSSSTTCTTTTTMRISGASMKAMLDSYDRHCNDLENFRDEKIVAMRVRLLVIHT